MARSILKPSSLLPLSRQVNVTDWLPIAFAVRLDGAPGAVGRVDTLITFEDGEAPPALIAKTRNW